MGLPHVQLYTCAPTRDEQAALQQNIAHFSSRRYPRYLFDKELSEELDAVIDA